MLVYKINVIDTKESGYNSTRILKENILSQSAMQKLRKGDMVGIKTLEQLCELLDMPEILSNMWKAKNKSISLISL